MGLNDAAEKDRIKREKIRKFESPIPFVLILRNWMFGKRKPDIYTRLTFTICSILGFTFLVWSVISYNALNSRELILQNKGIDINRIVGSRGIQLGYENGIDFVDRLQIANGIAILCWSVFFVGLVFLYRKSRLFVYLTLAPLALFLITNILFVGYTYFQEDTTTFDKIALLILSLSLIVHAYLMKNERNGGSISFFGEAEETPLKDIE